MRALLDVNVLIALLDADHVFHHTASRWLGEQIRQGWASCPITQNGCVRVMSHPAYPNPMPVRAVMERLSEATSTRHHAFWPDGISLLDSRTVDPTRVHGPRQVTDVYLLALAVRNGGRFVTFDEATSVDAVRGATAKHLVVL